MQLNKYVNCLEFYKKKIYFIKLIIYIHFKYNNIVKGEKMLINMREY